MPCPKCNGHLVDSREELKCANCGCRPVLGLPPGVYANPLPPERPERVTVLTISGIDAILANRAIPLRERMRQAGLCVQCGKKRRVKARPGATLCERHLKKMREAAKRLNQGAA